MGLVCVLKNSELLTDAYGGVGGWVKNIGNAYGCLKRGVGSWVWRNRLLT